MKKLPLTLTASLLLALSPAAFAGGKHDHDHKLAAATTTATAGTAGTADMSDAEVRKVDKDSGKITLKHGEIKNLDMPPMTMVFRAKDAAMLDQVKAGDKVKFVAEQINGQFTVTKIEAVK